MHTLLLDVEGTLLDTREAVRQAVGGDPAQVDRALAEGTLYTRLSPAERQRVSERELEWIASGQARLFPGVAELLQEASRQGHRLALVTLCSRPYTEALVRALGLEKWLHCWFCGPDKAALVEQALRELGRPACLLGDRESDAQAARCHGLPTFGAGWSPSRQAPELVLAHPLDLLRRIG